MAGSCERDSELVGSMKGGNFLTSERLSRSQEQLFSMELISKVNVCMKETNTAPRIFA